MPTSVIGSRRGGTAPDLVVQQDMVAMDDAFVSLPDDMRYLMQIALNAWDARMGGNKAAAKIEAGDIWRIVTGGVDIRFRHSTPTHPMDP